MSAKKERELRKQLAVCEELTKQHDRMMELHRQTGDELDAQLSVIEAQQREIIWLQRDVNRLKEWRYECVERRMERAVRVRRIRKAFGWASAACYFFFLGLIGSLECGNIPMWLAIPCMIFCACGGFVFACKAGVLVWE